MERRSFLKMSAAMGCAATVAGCNSSSSDVDVVPPTPPVTEGETMNWSACMVNCGSNCPVKVFSKDGVITRIESEFTTSDEYGNHDVRACLRGRSLRKRVYAPERLKYPMKRVGPRGSGQFERISWDEALDTVAERLQGIIDRYGNESLFNMTGTGSFAYFKGVFTMPQRLMNSIGGCLDKYGVYSYAQLLEAATYTFGTPYAGLQGSCITQIENSDLAVFIGYNPSEIRMSGSGISYDFLNIKQKNNLRTIIIDPRYTDTAVGKEDQWLPIRPGTDAALFEALAYEWITQDKVDQAFLDKYCVGYDEKTLPEGVGYEESYKSYILDNATVDDLTPGVNAKTPARAASITGIPEHTIIELAREIAAAKAPFIHLGSALNRQAAGENNMRAGYMLSILLGKIGLPGTTNGGQSKGGFFYVPPLSAGTNPVTKQISFFTYLQAVEDGKNMSVLKDGVRGVELDENGDGKLGTDIKAIVNWFSNSMVNQHSDVNKTREILKDESKCEFILMVDNLMTESAKFADIILPDTTWLEDEELVNQNNVAGGTATLIQMSSAIEPLFESRHSYDICTEIAKRMGVEQAFTEGKTKQQWLNEMYVGAQAANPGLPDREVMLEQGIYRKYLPHGSYIALKGFRDDPETNRLYTPSGKLEIYSSRLAHKARTWELREGDVISALPKYTPTWDGFDDGETREKYPLQLTGYHTKGRVHSSYHNIPWLREVVQDAVWMNPIDAQARNLKTGDLVHVFNERGTLEVEVKVTPRIMIGVTALGQGAWSRFEDGIDKGGNINTITSQRPTPLSKGNPQHTNRVEIRRA